MLFVDSGGARFGYFKDLRAAGLQHGVFTRLGGVSPPPWGSLNTGALVGDSPDHVAENLKRAAIALGRDPTLLVSVRQVHGNNVHYVETLSEDSDLPRQPAPYPDRQIEQIPEADAMITRRAGVTMFMRFADCVPILLYDPRRRAAGIAHAGWRGTVEKVAAAAVEQMAARCDSRPGDILAGIGPSICAAHYPVGEEVVDEIRQVFGRQAGGVLKRTGEGFQLDLRAANRLILRTAGVKKIEMANECTVEHPDRWYSHRGERGITGRFVALAGAAFNHGEI